MPEKTMLPVTEGQLEKLIGKLSDTYGSMHGEFGAVWKDNLNAIDRSIAQQIIECRDLPDIDTRAIVESTIRYFRLLNDAVEKATRGELEVIFLDNVGWHPWMFDVAFIVPDQPFTGLRYQGRLVCRAAGLDPHLIGDILSYYRPHEPNENEKSAFLQREFEAERYQIITNLFPFPKVDWAKFYSDDPIVFGPCILERNAGSVDVENIRSACRIGKLLYRHKDKTKKKK